MPFRTFRLCLTLCLVCELPHGCYSQEVLASETKPATTIEAGDTLATKQSLISQAAAVRDENADALRSAFGVGRVQYTVHEADQAQAVSVLDADIQVFFEKPKYRIHLVYEQKLNESVRVPGQSAEDFERWTPSSLAEQVVIFDGDQITSLECHRDGHCEGTIYFGFAKMIVMRNAGFPFEDPVTLWSQALNLEGLDLQNTTLTRLDDGGFVGLLNKNTYRMKFFILDRFGYDLRRVSSYRIGESQPFRDYLLDWRESNGVHFVQRFSNVVTSAGRDTGSNVQTVRKLTVEYSMFNANVEVDPEVFRLSALGIPDNTPFLDKRSSVEGGPKQLIYRDGSLAEASPVGGP